MSDCSCTQRVQKIHQIGYSDVLIGTWLVPRETAAVPAQVLCTPNNHAPVYSVTIRNRIRRVYVWLAVTWPRVYTERAETAAVSCVTGHLTPRATQINSHSL